MQDSLRTLSEETGGFAVVGRNDLANAYDRIVADNSSYYVLAYYPPSDKRDGKFHKIDVQGEPAGRRRARAARLHVTEREGAGAARASIAHGPSTALLDALAQPAARQRPDDARVARAVQGDGPECVRPVHRRGARP